MKLIVVPFLLLCPKTEMINISKDPWERIDYQMAESARKRCPEKFPNSPCLVRFVKVEDRMYRAICGARR
jgi:hypothetical protein